MYLNANKQFKQFLKEEINKTNKKLNEAYIRHLKNIICYSPIESDIDVLNNLKVSSNLGISFSELKRLSLQLFSPIFRTAIVKFDDQFQERESFQIRALTDLERLYSYYLDSNRFFNDFDTLENYLTIISMPLLEEYRVLNYYINCTFSFLIHESSLSTKEGIETYLNNAKGRYDEMSLSQLQDYLRNVTSSDSSENLKRNFEEAHPLVNGQADSEVIHYPVAAFWKLKLNLSPYQIALLISHYKEVDPDFDFAAISQALKESDPESPGLKDTRARILKNSNSN